MQAAPFAVTFPRKRKGVMPMNENTSLITFMTAVANLVVKMIEIIQAGLKGAEKEDDR